MSKQPSAFSKDAGNLSSSFICSEERCCASPTWSAQFLASLRRCSASSFVNWSLTALLRKAYPQVPPRVEDDASRETAGAAEDQRRKRTQIEPSSQLAQP